MLVSLATAARPGGVNEDFALAGPDAVVVLDGAGLPDVLDTGCVHGVPWFVRTLGALLHSRAADPRASLTECLADSILGTSQAHSTMCDLGNPFTPSATVAVARVHGEFLEWLVLADTTVAVRLPTTVEIIADHRVSQITGAQHAALAADLRSLRPSGRTIALARAQREVMNTVDGYWVAAADPKAAEESLTGAARLSDVRSAAILTDGAARAVDDFGTLTWPDLLEDLEEYGPRRIINRTRELERSDPTCLRWPRSKCHDDATAVLLQWEHARPQT
ncbi:hypothetical protein [Kitasatospora sp. NPDC058218]|uniref:hypothetical protein n=1 Tax=Kitasatospora sp. NPDC058218 TaxID=3346385 RepID=UPI0036DC6594